MKKSLNLGTLGERVSIVTHVGYYSNGNTYHVYVAHAPVTPTRNAQAHMRVFLAEFSVFWNFFWSKTYLNP